VTVSRNFKPIEARPAELRAKVLRPPFNSSRAILRYYNRLRQFSAISLLALLALSLLSPAFGSNADAGAAACCRRAGAHRCAMGSGKNTAAEPAFRTNRKCPLYSGFNLMPGYSGVVFATPLQASEVSFRAASLLKKQADVTLVVSSARAHSKRGPPSA